MPPNRPAGCRPGRTGRRRWRRRYSARRRRRQRDHDEADAGRAQAYRPDHQGHQRAHHDAHGQLHPAVTDAVEAEDTHGVATQAQEHGVPKADQSRKAQHQVQRQRRQRVDQDACAQRHVKGFAQPLRHERDGGQDQEQQRQHPAPQVRQESAPQRVDHGDQQRGDQRAPHRADAAHHHHREDQDGGLETQAFRVDERREGGVHAPGDPCIGGR
ncbi:hypothetical protein G6F65_017949 [Rhizopus arrhizus]|nr:hypothetical protein G6F65_017949 [Rhizopus arrhizus]